MTVDEAMEKMNEQQRRRLRCALNLHKLAGGVIAMSRDEPKDDEERIRRICTAGALAECYYANMRWLNFLLKCKYDRSCVSDEDTVKAWGEQYEWIVANGLRRAIWRWNGIRMVKLPFADIHAAVVEAHRKVFEFRKGVEK